MPDNDLLIERMRDKWREVPSTRQDRIFSIDAMRMNDTELLSWWEECRTETCGPEVRGWYQELYKDTFRGKTIADIGPGIGLDGIFFIENGANVTFVDIHRDNLLLLERICRLKGLEAEFYYIDDFEKYSFPHVFDAFLAIGSLINAPFEFTQKQIGALVPFLKPGGMVLWLGYPHERFVDSGAADGAEFAKTTDGERTPWVEWYDKTKISLLFGNDFTVSLEVNFGAGLAEFNVFQLDRVDNPSLPETERAAFPGHSLPSLQHIRRMMAKSDSIDITDGPGKEIYVRDAAGKSGGYQCGVYSKDRNPDEPAIGENLVFSYATIRDHAAIPYFSIPAADGREKRYYWLELDFPIIADLSCQWRIQVQDEAYTTLDTLRPPYEMGEQSDRLRLRVPFVIADSGVSRIRIVFCPETKAGRGVLPSRIRVEETMLSEEIKSFSSGPAPAPFPQHLPAALPHVGQKALGKYLGDRVPAIQWTESTNLPAPPAYDDLNDARVLRYFFRNFRPNRHLEFGTWKGNGVRRVLEESAHASVWTINVWEGEDKPDGTWAYGEKRENYEVGDMAVAGTEIEGDYIRTDAGGMIGIEYLRAGLGNRVNQIYSDSRLWHDAVYPDGFFDSVFIDGGHDAATSRSDLHKGLRLLRPGGLLLLHDFCPLPEVYAHYPSIVGVTTMIAEEIGNMPAMCSEFFWIEDTWLFCAIRKNGSGETENF